jgi:CRISPR/Cas system-associated protein Cas10 (large subunit of type III CRISPR-Cas system)
MIIMDRIFERIVYGLPILVEICPTCKKLLKSYARCRLCGDPVNSGNKKRYDNEDLCTLCHHEASGSVFIPNRQEIEEEAELIRATWDRREELYRRAGSSNKRITWTVPRVSGGRYNYDQD